MLGGLALFAYLVQTSEAQLLTACWDLEDVSVEKSEQQICEIPSQTKTTSVPTFCGFQDLGYGTLTGPQCLEKPESDSGQPTDSPGRVEAAELVDCHEVIDSIAKFYEAAAPSTDRQEEAADHTDRQEEAADHTDRQVAEDHTDRQVAEDHTDRQVAADHTDRQAVAADHTDRQAAAEDYADLQAAAADHSDHQEGAAEVFDGPDTGATLSRQLALRNKLGFAAGANAPPDHESLGLSPAFPSLPSTRLASLGLLPASLSDLRAANAAVSIVDPNGRYWMQGPMPQQTEEGADDEQENRVRDLAISFANDAGTLTERMQRASSVRAALEENLQEELLRMLESERNGEAKLVGSIVGRLSQAVQLVGALEQECRLNFAFHLLHRYSDGLRSEKEKMAGELEMLRQAVEDDNFYNTDGADAAVGSPLSRLYSARRPPTPDSAGAIKGKAKFQQLGRNVARTTSVTGLLQRLGRERERRRKQLLLQQQDSTEGTGPDDTFEDSAVFDETDIKLTSLAAAAEKNDKIDGAKKQSPAAAAVVEEETVLDRVDRLSERLFADRRVRLFVAPLTLLVAVVCLLWAIVYPIAKRLTSA